MDLYYVIVGFRYLAIDSVIDSVVGDKSLIRWLPTFKMPSLTLIKSLIRRANIRFFLSTESMANLEVLYSPCSEI